MEIRDRIKSLRRVPAKKLKPSPYNWQEHGDAQRSALRGALAAIGFADAVIARELDDGTLELIDGHLRVEEVDPDTRLPTLILDVSDEEAATLVATLDPIGALAGVNQKALTELLETVEVGEEVGSLLDELAGEWNEEQKRVTLTKLARDRPPKLAWVLVGIPTVRFGEIAAQVEALGTIEGIILESTVTDEQEDR